VWGITRISTELKGDSKYKFDNRTQLVKWNSRENGDVPVVLTSRTKTNHYFNFGDDDGITVYPIPSQIGQWLECKVENVWVDASRDYVQRLEIKHFELMGKGLDELKCIPYQVGYRFGSESSVISNIVFDPRLDAICYVVAFGDSSRIATLFKIDTSTHFVGVVGQSNVNKIRDDRSVTIHLVWDTRIGAESRNKLLVFINVLVTDMNARNAMVSFCETRGIWRTESIRELPSTISAVLETATSVQTIDNTNCMITVSNLTVVKCPINVIDMESGEVTTLTLDESWKIASMVYDPVDQRVFVTGYDSDRTTDIFSYFHLFPRCSDHCHCSNRLL
jgi:hypothetical protein